MIRISVIWSFFCFLFMPNLVASGVHLLEDEKNSVNSVLWATKESGKKLRPTYTGKFNNVRGYILTGEWIEKPKKIPLMVLDEMRAHLPLPILTAPRLKNTFDNQLDVAARAIYRLGSWIRLWDLYYEYGHCEKDGHKQENRGKTLSKFSKDVRFLWRTIIKNLNIHPDRHKKSSQFTQEDLTAQLWDLSRYYRAPLTDADEAIQMPPYREIPGYSPKSLDPDLLIGIFYLGLYHHSWVWEDPQKKMTAIRNPFFLTRGTTLILNAFNNTLPKEDKYITLPGDLPTPFVLPLRNSFELLSEWRPANDS